MVFKASFPERWRFQASVLAPVVFSLLVIAATVLTFLLWSTADLDARTLAREHNLAEHVIAEKIAALPHDQESVAIWDDSVVNTALNFDPAWVHENLGRWMHDYFGHDRTAVLDPANRPIYVMDAGRRADGATYFSVEASLRPFVDRLRSRLQDGELTAFSAGTVSDFPHVTGITVLAGTPAIVSVAPLTSDSGRLVPATGSEYLFVSVNYLDGDLATQLSQDYLLKDARFSRDPGATSQTAQLAVLAADGRIAGFLEWTPERPGATMLARTGIALGGGFAFSAVLIALLLYRLWRSSSALEAGRLEAQHRASHDILTGLANRARFDDMLGRAMLARRPVTEGIALLMLDLDRFKQVNDTFGHQSGDDLIRAVAQRLGNLTGPRDTLARLGGDEFAIIHHARRGLSEHLRLGEKIIDAVGKPFEIQGSEVFVGVSIGVVVIGETDADRRDIARKADIALYEAKSAGRNRAVVYEETMDELLQNRHTIEAELRDALRRSDQLSVAFQPLLDLRTGAVTGAEALVRWIHPELGQVSPAQFIPVAEGSGLIEPLGEFVLRTACAMGARFHGMRVAVNISPVQLRNPRFAERLFDLLLETGMRPTDLEIEITEGILLDDEDVVAGSLRTFRGAGIRIALDDFGTGYSSLNYLKRYPVDCIKIDRSFVSQLEDGSVSVAIVQAMVTLAHALGIEVTAEGVETDQQRSILHRLGCNTLQGYLLSPPVPQPEIEQLFLRQGAGIARAAVRPT